MVRPCKFPKIEKYKDLIWDYTYDSAGNKSAFTVKAGDDTKLSLTYDYDGESRLTSVTDEKGNEVVGYSYDTDGNLAGRTVAGSSLTTTYTYDYQNRLTAMKNQTDSGVISEYKSEYLLNGQKSKEDSDVTDKDGKKSAKTATYTYDLLGRITKETKTGSEDISYTYDSNNNRKEMTVGNKVTAYKYNKNDELLRTDTLNTDTEEDSVVIYKNDKNGNQLATVNRYDIPSEKKDSTYVDIDVTLGDNRLNKNVVNHYNALNQLTQTLTKNYKVSFTYDAEGLRTSKTVNGEKTVFVWDGDQLVLELSESGKVQKRYVRGNDLVYADKGTGTEKEFYVTDSHGNVVQLTDGTGKVTKNYEYDSFGNEVNPDSKDENPFRYCGEYYDKETEEIYLRARYYQPSVGRFLTRDTYTGEEDDVLSLHLYTYCENDGVNAWDPSGHTKLKDAVREEIKGMTKYKPDKLVNTGYYTKAYLNELVEKHIDEWSKDRKSLNNLYLQANDYELLARALFFESSSNNKGPKKRRNEIITIYKVVKDRMKKNIPEFGGNNMREVLTKDGQFDGLTYVDQDKVDKKICGYSRIIVDKNYINLSWVRAVVVATVAELNDQKIKYPDGKTYYYFHDIPDWEKLRKDKSNKWISFSEEPSIYYKVKILTKYSDTYFYDIKKNERITS